MQVIQYISQWLWSHHRDKWWHKPSHLEQYISRTHRFALHSRWSHVNIDHRQIHWSFTACTYCSSNFSSIRTWVSSEETTARLKTSVAFSPNKLPTSCAPGSSSTLRLVGKQMFKGNPFCFTFYKFLNTPLFNFFT